MNDAEYKLRAIFQTSALDFNVSEGHDDETDNQVEIDVSVFEFDTQTQATIDSENSSSTTQSRARMWRAHTGELKTGLRTFCFLKICLQ